MKEVIKSDKIEKN